MPELGVPDRRRHPRVVPGPDLTLTLPAVVDAEIMDISGGGAYVSSASPLRVGQRARLRTLLGREPFSAWFEVRRIDTGTFSGKVQRHRLGVMFTSIQEQAQKALQRFVKPDERPA